jgi:hypothetical protein
VADVNDSVRLVDVWDVEEKVVLDVSVVLLIVVVLDSVVLLRVRVLVKDVVLKEVMLVALLV